MHPIFGMASPSARHKAERKFLVRLLLPSLSVTNNRGSRRKKVYAERLGEAAEVLGSNSDACASWTVYPGRTSVPVNIGVGLCLHTYACGLWVTVEAFQDEDGKLKWSVSDLIDPEEFIEDRDVVFDSLCYPDHDIVSVAEKSLRNALSQFGRLKAR